MKTFPLVSLTIQQAQHKQFKLVDVISRHFTGSEFLGLGDLGVVPGLNRPTTTAKVEMVIADYFGAQAAMLVSGAGTGALRASFNAMISAGGTVLVHDAPIYPTSESTIRAMGLQIVRANYNDSDALSKAIIHHSIDLALVQHSRQKPDDCYELIKVIQQIKNGGIPVLVDDNYAALKVDAIGCELGADISTFSSFKLFGPEGVGVITGCQKTIKRMREANYSGGLQVQGHAALEVLRGMTFAPVMHAIQADVNEKLVAELNSDRYPYVKKAFIANAQSKVLLVELYETIAPAIIQKAESMGALPNPVGAESKYEIPPLFYQISSTFNKADPSLKDRMIRINPNRAGVDTVLNIFKKSYTEVKRDESCS